MANRWCSMCGAFHERGTACVNIQATMTNAPSCCSHCVENTATLQRIESLIRHAMDCARMAVPFEFDVR